MRGPAAYGSGESLPGAKVEPRFYRLQLAIEGCARHARREAVGHRVRQVEPTTPRCREAQARAVRGLALRAGCFNRVGASGRSFVDGDRRLVVSMLPSGSALACRREERVHKAFSVDHHAPGEATEKESAMGLHVQVYGEYGVERLCAGERARH